MKSLGRWSVNNRVAVNLLMVFIIVAGLYTTFRMRRELNPQFALDMINIGVTYPGASPEDVEEGVCIKIEEQIKGIEGIKRTLSAARENRGDVTVELLDNADSQRVLDEIRTEVDRIDTFPEEAEDPEILQIVNRNPAITVAVYGAVSERLLREVAEKIRDDLVNTDVISLASLVGTRNYEIAVEVSEENLRRYGITFDELVAAIRTGSVDLPGGAIKTDHGEILLRAKGQRYTGEEFAALPLITRPDGTTVVLGEVADVVDGFEDAVIYAQFNGRPAAMVQVNRTSTEDLIAISDAVQEYVAAHRDKMPPGVSIDTWFDLAGMVRERIDMLLRNGAQGIFLVFIALALFLNLRLAFWVAAGIPIAFMGAFMVLEQMGETVNMISLFAFIMTLGILVDDAIIVGENIFTHYGQGKSPVRAVVDGLGEVGGPVVMAVATTMVAFSPLLFVGGIIGKFIAVMPTAVIAILLVSLLEALLILPAHLNHALVRSAQEKEGRPPWHSRISTRVEGKLNNFIEKRYTPALRYVVANRYFTFAIGVGVLIISLGVIAGEYVPFVFMPKGESDWVIAEVNYSLGTPIESTRKTIEKLEQTAMALNDHYADRLPADKKLVTHTFSLAGFIPRRDWKPAVIGGHAGEVWIEMISSAHRPDLSVNEVINRWREQMGEIPGMERMSFFTIEGGPAGNPIEIQLVGDDFDRLRQAADALKAELATYPGAYDIADDFSQGKEEKQLRARESARSLGVTMGNLARQLRQAFYGEEAVRIQRGKDDIKVMVRYTEPERRRLTTMEQMRIRTPDGREIPIEEVADIRHGRAYSTIRRVDRKRVITVASDLDEGVGNASLIVADLKKRFLPELSRGFPDLRYDFEGQEKRTQESLDSLKTGYSLALMGIFVLLAAQFRSYVQPVIIMMSIPFGLIGAIMGHLVMGMPFTMISIFGVVALSGIVVNDALILIDFINRARGSGMDVDTAVIESGRARFRPVLLTSITTVAGLFPLLLERSFQAQFLIPMAVSISFGLVAATLLTLLFVPALYLIMRDIIDLTAALPFFRNRAPAPLEERADRQTL